MPEDTILTTLEGLPVEWSVAIVRHIFGDGIKYDVTIDTRDKDGYSHVCIGQARGRSLTQALDDAIADAMGTSSKRA